MAPINYYLILQYLGEDKFWFCDITSNTPFLPKTCSAAHVSMLAISKSPAAQAFKLINDINMSV